LHWVIQTGVIGGGMNGYDEYDEYDEYDCEDDARHEYTDRLQTAKAHAWQGWTAYTIAGGKPGHKEEMTRVLLSRPQQKAACEGGGR
jgi:hypothetical protein